MNETRSSGYDVVLPPWVAGALAVAVMTMATQVRFPVFGGRIALADVSAGIAFAGLLLTLFRQRSRVAYPWPLGVALALYIGANLFSRSGLGGAVESVQRVEQFFCGFLLFSVLLRHRPGWVPKLIGAAVALNLLVALVQCFHYGFGATIPPRDVAELTWGMGSAFTGLFRDRVALGVFLCAALIYGLPEFWRTQCTKVLALAALAVAIVLGFVAHGQVLVLGIVVLIFMAMLHSFRATLTVLAGVLLFLVTLLLPGGRSAVLARSLSPMQEGNGIPKICHVEVVAAARMASQAPLAGVGAGRYQDYIGSFYRELPNPPKNTIETDTQSGLGILASTVGFPAATLFLLVLAYGAATGIRAFHASAGSNGLALGAGFALVFFLAAMLITDPFISGIGWIMALVLASCFAGAGRERGVVLYDWRGVLAWGVGFGVLAVLTAAIPAGNPLARTSDRSRVAVVIDPGAVETGGQAEAGSDSSVAASGAAIDFFHVVDAGDAVTVSAPAVKGTDSQAANKIIIDIPDKKGTPPEGEAPAMKYGGAAFDLDIPADLECKVWLRVWWEGSCGNTIFVQVGDDGKPVVVGNDGTYKSWHWMDAPTLIKLSKGKQKLLLLNREDGVRVDQILITNDTEYVPQGIEEE